ncbi:MAG: DUF362 domain-containing protein [Clostridia bacterium]|nr:DUF362 domain-containing protein [Clostridia bacterium]
MIILSTDRELNTAEWDRIFEELGLTEKLDGAGSVVIKPNFAAGSYVDPKTHVISDLSLLRSCITYIAGRNEKAEIYVAESDSTGYGFAYLKFEHLGLPGSLNLPPEVIGRVRLLDLSRDRLVKIENPAFRLYKSVDRQLWLSKTLADAGFTVNLGNLKTHAVTGYTGACKNLFGCLPDSDKSVNHPRISKVVHDLVLAIRPDLNVVDAFYGMEKNGPVQGIDVDSGYRVFSNDAFEADVYAAKTVGYPSRKVGYLRLLGKTLGIGLDSDAQLVRKYKKPGLFLRFMNSVGVGIQGFGQAIASFGHRIHSCPSFSVLMITLFRPVLLKLFDYEKLKSWKRRFMKLRLLS